jgi:hypothetical protein
MTGHCAEYGDQSDAQAVKACEYCKVPLCSQHWSSHECEGKSQVEGIVSKEMEDIKRIESAFPANLEPLARQQLVGLMVGQNALHYMIVQAQYGKRLPSVADFVDDRHLKLVNLNTASLI